MKLTHVIGAVSALAIGLAVAAGTAGAQYYEGVDSGFPAPTGDPSVLPPGATLMRVFDGGCILTEGVAAGHDGYMYFSDITFSKFCQDPSGLYAQAGNIWRYDPKSGETTIFRSPSGMSNGIKFDRDGNMLAALGADFGGRMLIKTDMSTGKSYILSGTYNGRSYNALNDISIDETGRIYFSDPRYLGHEPVFQPGFAVYRLDADGSVDRIVTNGGKTNGVLVTPDQSTLYVVSNDNGWLGFMQLDDTDQGPTVSRHLLQAYDLNADGTVSNRRVVIDYSELYPGKPCSGPDGIVNDVDGNLYMAERCEHRPGIAVRTATGEELAFISTGEELPTNVGFGRGDESNVLYVTSGNSLYKIQMVKDGYQLP
jgi:gluconolactonase